MKSLLVTLIITLLLTISSFSQTTYPVVKTILDKELILITPEQLKLTNKIFAENNQLILANSYLKDEVSLMDEIYKEQSRTIGTLKGVVNNQETIILNHEKKEHEYKFQLKEQRKKTRKTFWSTTGVAALIVVTTILILK